MQGESELTLSADATLASTPTKQVWAVPPIDVDFQIVGFTASGICVTDLNVTEKSGYDSTGFVKYLAGANGSYQVQVSSPSNSGGMGNRARTKWIIPSSSERDTRACIPSAISLYIFYMGL